MSNLAHIQERKDALTTAEYMAIAKTIRSQISPMTVLRCAARDFVGGQENGEAFLMFRVTKFSEQRAFYKIKIFYDYGKDLYNVQFLKINHRNLSHEVIETYEEVYCDMLNNLLDEICK